LYHKIDNRFMLEDFDSNWRAKHFLSNMVLESGLMRRVVKARVEVRVAHKGRAVATGWARVWVTEASSSEY